jgi:hypothetical protein
MSSAVSSLISKAGHVWCELMHNDIMWPVEGRYRCRTCFREYPVEWGKEHVAEHSPMPAAKPEFRTVPVTGLRP